MFNPLQVFFSLPQWQRRLAWLGLIVVVGVALGLWQPYTPARQPAPATVFTSIEGTLTDLKALTGKPVIVTFWATDCHSCVEEIPDLIDLYQDYHAQGLEMIAVAMFHDIPSHVVEMTQLKQIPYTVALDVDAKHANAFGRIFATPTTFLIGPDNTIVKQIIGKIKPDLVRQWLDNVKIRVH